MQALLFVHPDLCNRSLVANQQVHSFFLTRLKEPTQAGTAPSKEHSDWVVTDSLHVLGERTEDRHEATVLNDKSKIRISNQNICIRLDHSAVHHSAKNHTEEL